MVDPNDDPIRLVDPRNEAWREAFEAERDRVRDALVAHDLDDRVERIEHVGSTAVPDLAAKDVVDLDVVVEDDAVGAVSNALEAELGGTRLENDDGWHPLFRAHDGQRFNDHVFGASSEKWRISVVTRDVLRYHPDLRAEYADLKRELAAAHDDLTGYSVGKSAFIDRVVRVARTEDAPTFAFDLPGREDGSEQP